MPGSLRKLSGWVIGGASRSFIFFVLFYLYVWFCVDLRLIYYGAGVITNFPVFYKGWAFFSTFLSYPGGPLEYLSAFLSQLFYYSWAGALVVTVQAWLLSVCIDYLSKATNLPRFRWMRFIPPILLLILYTRYTYHFPTTLAFLTALLLVCLYLKMTLSQTAISRYLGTFLSLSVIMYYLAGGAFLLFVVVCAIYELFFRSRWKTGLFYLLSAVVIPYVVGLLVFRVSIIDAFSNLLPFSWKILYYESRKRGVTIVYLLYLLPPLTLLASGLWQILRQRLHFVKGRPNKKPAKKRNKSSNRPAKILSWFRHSPKLRWGIESLLLLAVAGSAVFLSSDENLKIRFKVDYYAYHKMWPELLKSARSNPTNPFIAHAINRALYHTGRLNYDMFSWPQNPDYLFLSDTGYKWVDWQIFDVYLDLGLINIAENALTDCLEGLGDRPMVLQRLALINMVKANYDSARVYLGALSKTLFDADWAHYYLARLKSDPDLSEDTEIQRLRSLCLQKDFGYTIVSVEKMLLRLLEKNKQNRMAFEYLMAWFMLNKHLGKLVQNIERLQDFGYPRIPTHYEEASLIYVYGTGKPLNLSSYQPNPQLRQQIEDFSRLLSSYGADKQAAFKELSKNFRNTYLFYYIYAPSGTKK
ncbi:MAG TPA: DUF6057 family protein [Sedimentisphaerales bacterium]|nr:DUF6057 family protein [Sedimentisphaerales bacterium]